MPLSFKAAHSIHSPVKSTPGKPGLSSLIMDVTFDIRQFPDLVLAAREILDFAAGKTSSVDFKLIDSAIADLERARKTCEEVEQLQAA